MTLSLKELFLNIIGVFSYLNIMTKTINDNLIKNSAVVAISNKISLLQRKLFNFLIAFAYIDLKEKESFTIELHYLKLIVGFNSKNLSYLKEALKGLMASVVEFNMLSKDKEAWSATTLLSSVEFSEGKCTYSFSPVLRKRLYEPNIYAKIKLSTMKLFSSKYSLCLYEIFVDYQNIGQTPIISLDDFKKLMGVEKEKYKEFKRFSARVIKPAIAELSSIGWYDVKVSYTKANKRVTALKFHFKELQRWNQAQQGIKVFKNLDLQKRLIDEFGLTLRQAKKVITTYPVPYIKESLEIIKHKIHQKLIKNIPAYTLTVLKNDYCATIKDKQKISLLSNPKEDARCQVSNRNRLENNESTTSMNLLYNADNYSLPKTQTKALKSFYTLKEEKQQELIAEFKKDKISSDILQTIYKKEGITGTLIQTMFVWWLEKKRAEPLLSNNS